MPIITAITPQVKNPDFYNLFVDGKFVCGVTITIIGNYKLKVSKEITEPEIDEIIKESEIGKLYNRALRFLAVRPRSESEIDQYVRKTLGKKKEPVENLTETIEVIINRLKKYNYVNDSDFTKWWIENRTNAKKPSGKRKIVSELYKKGIAKETIENVWQSLNVDNATLINQLLPKLKAKYDIKNSNEKAKLIRVLMSRGFGWDEIRSVLQ